MTKTDTNYNKSKIVAPPTSWLPTTPEQKQATIYGMPIFDTKGTPIYDLKSMTTPAVSGGGSGGGGGGSTKQTPEAWRDSETGYLSGITTSSGNTYFGMSPKEVREYAERHRLKTELPQGMQEVGQQKAEMEEQQRRADIAAQLGQVSPNVAQGIGEAPIDWGQAITAGTIGNLPSVLSRTATGAAAGAGGGAFLGGVGAVPGAIIGGVGGLITALWSGTASNIKQQQKGEIAASVDVLEVAKANMRQIRILAAVDPSRADEAVDMYNFWLAQSHMAHAKLKAETKGNLNKFMEDGTDILSDFELFFMPGGYADIQKQRIYQAIAQGTPASPEQLLMMLQEMKLEEGEMQLEEGF